MRSALSTAALLSLVFSGCDPLGGYNGADPSTSPIVNEEAIVRQVDRLEGGVVELVLDRLRFLEGSPDSIDRVVIVQISPDIVAGFTPPLVVGDTVTFSSTFLFAEGGGRSSVPNWAINEYWEPPVAHHVPVAIKRSGT